jgi:putative endopeptidase
MIRVLRASPALILAAAACAACSGHPAAVAAAPGSAAPRDLAAEPAAAPPGPGAASAERSAPGDRVGLSDIGLEASSLDRTADPCVDFYQFACGGWIQNNPIPADRSRWGRADEVDDRARLEIQAILDDAQRSIGGDAGGKKLGNFYASCLDEAAIDRAGTAAIRPLLAKIQGVKDGPSWLAALAELHRLGIWAVWTNRVRADLKSSATSAIYLDAARLGLADRDYYVKPEFADKLERYRDHVARMLGLVAPGGPSAATAAAAQAVVGIEVAIARRSRTAAQQRDVQAAYNPTDLAALGAQVKSVDWPRYFQLLGTAPSKRLIIETPALFGALDQLRGEFQPAQWASYFTYHLLVGLAHALPRAFDDEALELQKLWSGAQRSRERSRRCVDFTSAALGELVGERFVARDFAGSAKQIATQLVEAIAQAMADELAGLDWMAAPTQQIALGKLAGIARMIGYPERWRSYDFEVRRDDFTGNAMRAAAFEVHRRLAGAGKPVDRGQWPVNAFELGAYYDPTGDRIALPAGILQPPFFAPDRSVAANLGGLALVIGHELIHGFDEQGAQFDAEGNLATWWQSADLARFGDRASCLADQYSTFEAVPRRFVQGPLTVGEAIADLGGVRLAFRAYRALRNGAARTYVADGLSEDQQFFVAVGQAWCGSERPAEAERQLAVDPHPPAKFRVYGALRNLGEFADAFRCAAGTPMRPTNRCTVW